MAQGDLRGTLTASVNSVTNPTVASGSVAVSVGDLVFGTMSQQTALTATTTITDNLGNTYAYVNAGTDAGTVSIRSFYARVTAAGTLTTVNVPATASTNDASIVVDVIEGPFSTSPLDANPANATDATTPFTCPATGTLAQASEVVMAAIALAANQTVAATSPSTLAGTVARANASVGQSRRLVSATTTVTPEFTGTSATAAQVTASFKLDPQPLTPSLFNDGDTFHQPTVASTYGLAPGLFDDGTDTFHGPTVASVSPLTAALFNSGGDAVFHNATVAPGPVGLAPSLFDDSGDSFHSATVVSTYPLTVALFDDGTDTFFSPTVEGEAGSQNLAPSLYVDDDTFFSATVAPGPVNLDPGLYSDADSFHTATVASTYDLTPDLYANAAAFFSATVAPGPVNLAPSLYEDGDTFFAATVLAAAELLPALYADDDAFFAATVTPGEVNLDAPLFSDVDTFFSATVAEGGAELLPSIYVDADAFFSATVTPGSIGLVASHYEDLDTFWSPTVGTAVQSGDLRPVRLTGETSRAVLAGSIINRAGVAGSITETAFAGRFIRRIRFGGE